MATTAESGNARAMPTSPEQLTPAWLESVLTGEFPGLSIRSAEATGFIHGASTKVRLALEGDDPALPSSIIVKAGFEEHSTAMRHMHENEMRAYRDVIPTVDVEAPRCFYAGIDQEGQALVILEDLDLRQIGFLSLQSPISFDLACAFLDGLARIHARWWDAPELTEDAFDWLPDTSEERFFHYFDILGDSGKFGHFKALPRCAAMPHELLDPARVRAAHAAMRERHRDQPQVICHGDMHLGNLYVADGAVPGFLDWQPRRAAWSLDVTYFLIAGLDVVDRRRWAGALLQHYLARLEVHGVSPPDFDTAWRSFREDVVWGLLIWMLNGTEFQTEANNTAAAARFAAAMIDYDTFGLLGV